MISRRDFSAGLASVLAVSLGPGHLVEAQESAAKAAPSGATLPPALEQGLSPNEQAEVESRYRNVIRRWGDRLSSEQRERVHRVLVVNSRMMQPMSAFRLQNGDPPAEVLAVAKDNGSPTDSTKEALLGRPE